VIAGLRYTRAAAVLVATLLAAAAAPTSWADDNDLSSWTQDNLPVPVDDTVERTQAIVDSGMVPEHGRALSRVAVQRGEVILMQATNPSATPNVAAGNRTKDLFMKGKSASGGPAKGWIPVDQELSEKVMNPSQADLNEYKTPEGVREHYKAVVQEALDKKLYEKVLVPDATDPNKMVEVLGKNGVPITADNDIAAIGRPKGAQLGEVQNAGPMGNVRPEDLATIKEGNIEALRPVRPIYQHGAANEAPVDPGLNYPLTAFEDTGKIVSIPKGPPEDPNKFLKEYVAKLEERGIAMKLRPEWTAPPKEQAATQNPPAKEQAAKENPPAKEQPATEQPAKEQATNENTPPNGQAAEGKPLSDAQAATLLGFSTALIDCMVHKQDKTLAECAQGVGISVGLAAALAKMPPPTTTLGAVGNNAVAVTAVAGVTFLMCLRQTKDEGGKKVPMTQADCLRAAAANGTIGGVCAFAGAGAGAGASAVGTPVVGAMVGGVVSGTCGLIAKDGYDVYAAIAEAEEKEAKLKAQQQKNADRMDDYLSRRDDMDWLVTQFENAAAAVDQRCQQLDQLLTRIQNPTANLATCGAENLQAAQADVDIAAIASSEVGRLANDLRLLPQQVNGLNVRLASFRSAYPQPADDDGVLSVPGDLELKMKSWQARLAVLDRVRNACPWERIEATAKRADQALVAAQNMQTYLEDECSGKRRPLSIIVAAEPPAVNMGALPTVPQDQPPPPPPPPPEHEGAAFFDPAGGVRDPNTGEQKLSGYGMCVVKPGESTCTPPGVTPRPAPKPVELPAPEQKAERPQPKPQGDPKPSPETKSSRLQPEPAPRTTAAEPAARAAEPQATALTAAAAEQPKQQRQQAAPPNPSPSPAAQSTKPTDEHQSPPTTVDREKADKQTAAKGPSASVDKALPADKQNPTDEKKLPAANLLPSIDKPLPTDEKKLPAANLLPSIDKPLPADKQKPTNEKQLPAAKLLPSIDKPFPADTQKAADAEAKAKAEEKARADAAAKAKADADAKAKADAEAKAKAEEKARADAAAKAKADADAKAKADAEAKAKAEEKARADAAAKAKADAEAKAKADADKQKAAEQQKLAAANLLASVDKGLAADKQKAEADKQKATAEQQNKAATNLLASIDKGLAADKQKAEADKRKAIAEQQNKATNLLASIDKGLAADKQKAEADKQKATAEQQNKAATNLLASIDKGLAADKQKEAQTRAETNKREAAAREDAAQRQRQAALEQDRAARQNREEAAAPAPEPEQPVCDIPPFQYGEGGLVETMAVSPNNPCGGTLSRGTITIEYPPEHGLVTINGRDFTYRSQPGFTGTDAFTIISHLNGVDAPLTFFAAVADPASSDAQAILQQSQQLADKYLAEENQRIAEENQRIDEYNRQLAAQQRQAAAQQRAAPRTQRQYRTYSQPQYQQQFDPAAAAAIASGILGIIGGGGGYSGHH